MPAPIRWPPESASDSRGNGEGGGDSPQGRHRCLFSGVTTGEEESNRIQLVLVDEKEDQLADFETVVGVGNKNAISPFDLVAFFQEAL